MFPAVWHGGQPDNSGDAMKRSRYPAPLFPAIGLLLAGIVTSALPASAEDLTSKDAQAIAKDAYIYGFPIVENYKAMYAEAIAKGGGRYKSPFNTLKSEAKVVTPADTTVETPTADTLYSYLWMDLRTEPLVLGVPKIEKGRYYSIQLVDLYTFDFDYIGSRTTGDAMGHYMVAGPKWKGEKPKGADKVIRCETEFALAIYRTQLFSPNDLDNVKKIQSEYTVQTLSGFLGKPAPKAAPGIEFPPPDSKPVEDLAFFKHLNFLMQFCPTDPSEAELMARFARIGVGPGTTFDASKLDSKVEAALKSGIADGVAAIAAAVPTANRADLFGTRAYLKGNYLKRAVGAKVNLYGNSKEESLYSLYLSDAKGKPLDAGKEDYVLKFAATELPPVEAFWSLTMYDGKSQGLVANPIHRYLISSAMLESMKRDSDGGVTLVIQHASPGKGEEANWLPAPEGPFYLVMRLYWPKPAAAGWHLDAAAGVARRSATEAAPRRRLRGWERPRKSSRRRWPKSRSRRWSGRRSGANRPRCRSGFTSLTWTR